MHGSNQPAGPVRPRRAGPAVSSWRGPLFVAILAGVAVVGTLDPAGSYPRIAAGPGITLDEVFNVEMGVYQWRQLREQGWKLWTSPTREQTFGDPRVNNDHPPLGRLWLGVWHDLTLNLVPPVAPAGFGVTACARTGSAAAFALTVFLVGLCAARWYGGAAGWIAALSYAIMPRVFAHAHLAALETSMNLTFAATLFWIADRWVRVPVAPTEPPGSPAIGSAIVAGLLLGLALLTKIQAVLLPLPVALWALYRFRRRAVLPLALFGLIGLAVFCLGWPWLWIDPLQHFRDYFVRGVERSTVHCFYLGQRLADVDVPWHYPFVTFAVTVPLALHLLAAGGGWTAFRRPESGAEAAGPDVPSASRTALLLLCVGFVLAFFAIPGIAAYDGERLFLVVCPLWAVLIGPGGARMVRWLSERRSPRFAAIAMALFLAAQGYGVVGMHPCQLSYYNLAVGGLRGADRLGFERSYWADSITRPLLEQLVSQIPRGATLDVAPVLHPILLDDLPAQSPPLREHGIRLRAYDDPHRELVRYVLVFRRRADPWHSLEPAPAHSRLLAETRRDGVQLAALYELDHPAGGVTGTAGTPPGPPSPSR